MCFPQRSTFWSRCNVPINKDFLVKLSVRTACHFLRRESSEASFELFIWWLKSGSLRCNRQTIPELMLLNGIYNEPSRNAQSCQWLEAKNSCSTNVRSKRHEQTFWKATRALLRLYTGNLIINGRFQQLTGSESKLEAVSLTGVYKFDRWVLSTLFLHLT